MSTVYGQSGGGVLYLSHRFPVKVGYNNQSYTLSVKIKKNNYEIYYDHHAYSAFTFHDIILDFWSKVLSMLEERDQYLPYWIIQKEGKIHVSTSK